jgi:hypothetical protein
MKRTLPPFEFHWCHLCAVFAISYATACVRKCFKSGVLNYILEGILQVINRWSISICLYLLTNTHSLHGAESFFKNYPVLS